MTKYKLILDGGSIGEVRGREDSIYDTKEEARRLGKQYIKSFSGGFRNYYHPRYKVVEVK